MSQIEQIKHYLQTDCWATPGNQVFQFTNQSHLYFHSFLIGHTYRLDQHFETRYQVSLSRDDVAILEFSGSEEKFMIQSWNANEIAFIAIDPKIIEPIILTRIEG